MSHKKDIDRLFQEKFKDFEASPPKHVWKNIEKELKKDKKPKFIPLFWYKTAGIAAAISLLLFLGNSFLQPNQVEVVNTTNPKKDIYKDSSGEPLKNAPNEKANQNTVFLPNKNSPQPETRLVKNTSTSAKKEGSRNINTNHSQEKNNRENKAQTIAGKKHLDATIAQHDNASAEAKTRNKNLQESLEDRNPSKLTTEEKNSNKKTNLIVSQINSDSTLTKESLEKENALAQREKELKEETNNDDKQDEESENVARWNIRPNVSPVYYGNLSDSGSPIDPQFSNNDASGEVSMAYGVNFAYAVSKKIKVRTGVSRVQLNYSTNDVAFTSSVEPMSLHGVNNNARTKNIQVVSARSSANNNNASLQGRNINPYTDGSLKQQVGFIEIPLEVEYAILDQRFGIHLIGGASSLILNNNEIAVSSAEGVTNIGKANNLNNVSFSTNLGVGLGYEISKKLDFNVEPTFKYQLNTFTGNTNGFKPYYFGVYTGLNFKF